MSTNCINACKDSEDTEMAECDGEKVVTMMDVLKEQEDFEEDVNAVLGASDEKNCTFSKGYIKRQAIYACKTCCSDAMDDPTKRAGVCLACSLTCHEKHELIELYTKRNFRCDCGNSKFNQHPCQFTPNKTETNEENSYNQNFGGVYCICHRPYPDPESSLEQEMIQCIVCEDWFHSSHLDALVPSNENYTEMICKACMKQNEFLYDYTELIVNKEDVDVDILNESAETMDTASSRESSETMDTASSREVPTKNTEKLADDDSLNNKEMKIDDHIGNENIDDTKLSEQHNIEPNSLGMNVPEQSLDDESKLLKVKQDSGIPINDEDLSQPEIIHSEDNVSDNNKDKNDSEPVPDDTNQAEEIKLTVSSETESKDMEYTEEIKASTTDIGHGNNSEMDQKIIQQSEQVETTDASEELQLDDSLDNKALTNMNKQVEDLLLKDSVEIIHQISQDADDANEATKSNFTVNSPVDKTATENENKNETMELSPVEDISESKTENIENHENQNGLNSSTDFVANESIDNSNSKTVDADKQDDDSINDKDKLENNIIENKDTQHSSTDKDQLDNDVKENENDKEDDMGNILSDGSPKHVGIQKRKLSTECDDNDSEQKKTKLGDLQCVRPRGLKKVHKGATFWPSNFRQKLCTCNECISMYKDLSVLFLIDPDDTVTAYEQLGKERTDGKPASQYEKGMAALSSLGRVQQINALTEYSKLRDKLLEFLKSFKERKVIVKEEDIKAFFAGMKPVREPDGVYFCR